VDPVTVYKAARTADAVRRAVPWRFVFAAVVVAVLVGVLLVSMLVSTVTGSMDAADRSARAATSACIPEGGGTPRPVAPADGKTAASLNAVQTAHASTIIAVGAQKGIPADGIVVALATASQESGFKNYANDGSDPRLKADQRGVERSLTFPHDAVGRDHGSVNVFQQQYPWWGTLEQLMDPVYAAGKFYDTLLAVEGWQDLPITVAAQRVQRSAFPTAYADDEPLARELLAALLGDAALPLGDAVIPPPVCVEPVLFTPGADPGSTAGYGNGRIPPEALTPLAGYPGEMMRADAAAAFAALVGAYPGTIGVSDSYRDYDSQVRLARPVSEGGKGLYGQGGLAARPGTSNHGWGLSLDLRLDSAALSWMRANAGRFGFVEDVPGESWHWTYTPTSIT
jgi:hypothetical protein